MMLLLVGCASREPVRVDNTFFALDTVLTLSAWSNAEVSQQEAEAILEEAKQLCLDYEQMFSKSIPTSDLSRLNAANGQPTVVSPQTAYLIEQSLRYSELTDGYFDITIFPLKELWDFKAEAPTPPTDEQIGEALAKVGYRNIELGEKAIYTTAAGESVEGRTVTLHNGATIDLGAIAKGFIADEVYALLRERGITSALINLGGNVLVLGEKTENTPWRVGVQDPEAETGSYLASVAVSDQSVVTSGVYERFFEYDGVIYHHLLDPFTGRPADVELVSVTILSSSSMAGDAMSTSCFVLGLEKGLALAESQDGIEAIFITAEGEIVQTSGVKNFDFELAENEPGGS